MNIANTTICEQCGEETGPECVLCREPAEPGPEFDIMLWEGR